jgi:hypothetical protein
VLQVTVETLVGGHGGFLINVFSDKSCPGLLVSVLEAFDELGLSVLQATASCADSFRLEAVGGEVKLIIFFLSQHNPSIQRRLVMPAIDTLLILLGRPATMLRAERGRGRCEAGRAAGHQELLRERQRAGRGVGGAS